MPIINDLWRALLAAAPNREARLLKKVNRLLKRSYLRERNSAAVWDVLWDKLLFANAMAVVAEPAVDAIRRNGCFADPASLRDKSWNLVQEGRHQYRAVGTNAKRWNRGLLPGPHTTVALKGSPKALKRLFAIRELGCRYQTGLDSRLSQACSRQLKAPLDVGLWQEIRRSIFPIPMQDPAVGLIGHSVAITTAQHMVLDLGFPTLKPDIWFTRFHAAATGAPPAPNRAITLASLETLEAWLAARVAEIDYSDKFLKRLKIDLVRKAPFRFADLVIAKFGMTPDPSWGIEISPTELDSRILRTRLAGIRDAMAQCEASRRRCREDKQNEKNAGAAKSKEKRRDLR